MSIIKNQPNGCQQSVMFCKKTQCRCCNEKPNEVRPTRERNINETLLTNVYFENKDGEKWSDFADPMYRNIQEGGCPGKILPVNKRGCGFHLHFCIGDVRRSGLIKKKQTRQMKSGQNKAEDNLKQQLEVHEAYSKNTSFSGKNTDITRKSPSSHSLPPSNQLRTSVSPRNFKTAGQTQSPKSLPEGRAKEGTDNEKQSNLQHEPILRHSNSAKTSSSHSLVHSAQNDTTPTNPKIRFSSVERKIVSEDLTGKEEETSTHSQKGQNSHEEPNTPIHVIGSADESAAFKEYEVQNRIARGLSTKRSTFVRNSLISVRKGTSFNVGRYSMDDSMMSEILTKLNHIEEKITELEKNSTDQGSHVKNIVGISCNKQKKSSSSNNLNEKGREESQDSDKSGPPSKDTPTVVIKVCGDDVTVKTPERGSVTKKNNINWHEDNQLIYHNTHELDAHRIAYDSHPKLIPSDSTRSSKPKTTAEVNSQKSSPMKNKTSKMWRRVSEELKV